MKKLIKQYEKEWRKAFNLKRKIELIADEDGLSIFCNYQYTYLLRCEYEDLPGNCGVLVVYDFVSKFMTEELFDYWINTLCKTYAVLLTDTKENDVVYSFINDKFCQKGKNSNGNLTKVAFYPHKTKI